MEFPLTLLTRLFPYSGFSLALNSTLYCCSLQRLGLCVPPWLQLVLKTLSPILFFSMFHL
ncbi:hypothetical protein I79_026196 [Cricetulus griseus]|uniref:Uncharacterized protein n=1 Tax=Cricetulus griseus TaxID=10029 RepID=G3IQ94_CRIGR|nr:hypothetical protein I79_026196 [Cricetulus griseus]